MKTRPELLELYNKFKLALRKPISGSKIDQFQVRINDCISLLRYLLGEQPVFNTIPGLRFNGEKDLKILIEDIEAQRGRSFRRSSNKVRRIQIDRRFQDLIALIQYIAGEKNSFMRLNVFLKGRI